jgi:hypothetical protein
MKRCATAAIAALMLCFLAASQPSDETAQLTVNNLTGETLELTVDGGIDYDIEASLTINLAAGNHTFIIRDPAGDELPREEILRAGVAYTWTISQAPDQDRVRE